ncbi:MAG: hypothetical protein IH594_03880 [Bacteroidales bacterium]|nr:hypothetical protein [Bacteroidales bacterium]
MQATGNETYWAILPQVDTEKSIRYYLEATDIQNQTTCEPYAGELELIIGLPVSNPFIQKAKYHHRCLPQPGKLMV